MNAGGGRGPRGRGCGGGRQRRNRFHASDLTGRQPAAVDPEVAGQQELQMLKAQAEHFSNALEEVNERIEQFESETPEKPSSKE